jgi:hypothetical protein
MAQPQLAALHSPPTLYLILPPSTTSSIFSSLILLFFYFSLFVLIISLPTFNSGPISTEAGKASIYFFISSAQISHYSAIVPDFLNANVHLRVSTWIHTHKRPHRATMSTLIAARPIPAASSQPQPHMANSGCPLSLLPRPDPWREGTLSCL